MLLLLQHLLLACRQKNKHILMFMPRQLPCFVGKDRSKEEENGEYAPTKEALKDSR